MIIAGGDIVADVAAVKAAEARAIDAGVTEDMLIENAVAGLLRAVSWRDYKRVFVVYGGGNNGADGLVLARHLAAEGLSVTLVEGAPAGRNAHRVAAAIYCGAEIGDLSGATADDCIVDALFGTGLNRPVEGELAAVIEKVNASAATVVAVDVPSGLNAQTGESGAAVKADKTVTFGCVKIGMLLSSAPDLVGEVTVVPIGLRDVAALGRLVDARVRPPKRAAASHKGDYGRVYVIGGSARMTGAPVLTACAAVAAGAGYTTVCTPDVAVTYPQTAAMCMRLPLPLKDGFAAFDEAVFAEICRKADCVVIGNGMGETPDLGKMLAYLSAHFDGTLVVDADGLNALAKDLTLLHGHRPKVVLTPHPKELERLIGAAGDVVTRAKRLAKTLDCVVAAKNTVTTVTDGENVVFNVAGTPALAKGGSGDVLAGIVAAYACRMPLLDATAAACRKMGQTAAELYSDREDALLDFELIERIARAL